MKTQLRKTVACYAALTFAGAFSFPMPKDVAISSAAANSGGEAEVTPLRDTAQRFEGASPVSQGNEVLESWSPGVVGLEVLES